MDWDQHVEEVGCTKYNNNGFCTKLNSSVNFYNSKGVAKSTNNYNAARLHISQRDGTGDINNFENLYLDYNSGDFSHNDCTLFYDKYNLYG